MWLKIVQIGNSQGITIPQAIMEQCELTDEVEAIVEGKKNIQIITLKEISDFL